MPFVPNPLPGGTSGGGLGGGGGSGGGGGGGSGADGDPLFIPLLPNAEALGIVLRRAIQAMELPRALSRLAELLKRSGDAEANHIAQQGVSVATAAYNDEQNLLNALYAVASYSQNVSDPTNSVVHTGTALFNFSGTGARVTQNITATWVTASSIIFGVSNTPIPTSPNPMFDLEKFQFFQQSVTAGVGFGVMAYNSGTPPTGDYSFNWFAF